MFLLRTTFFCALFIEVPHGSADAAYTDYYRRVVLEHGTPFRADLVDSLDARLISMLTGAGVRGAARFASSDRTRMDSIGAYATKPATRSRRTCAFVLARSRSS